MGNPQSKIPPALHAWVLELAGDGKTGEEIAAALWREHHLESSSRAVQRLIERYRTERAEVAKVVVRDELRQHLRRAVHRIASIAARAAQMERRARDRAAELRQVHPQHPTAIAEDILALKAQMNALRASDRLLHFAGLSEPDKPEVPGRTETITEKREKLLRRIKELAGQTEPKKTPVDDPPKPDNDPVH